MPQKNKDQHRRHIAAFLATGAFLFIATATDTQLSGYVTPEEAGFLPPLKDAAPDTPEVSDTTIICSYEKSGEVVAVMEDSDMNFIKYDDEPTTSEAVIKQARANTKILEELALVTEEEQTLRSAAPEGSTKTDKPILREIGRWFGL